MHLDVPTEGLAEHALCASLDCNRCRQCLKSHYKRCLRCLLTLTSLPELVQFQKQPDVRATDDQSRVVPSYCVMLADEVHHIHSRTLSPFLLQRLPRATCRLSIRHATSSRCQRLARGASETSASSCSRSIGPNGATMADCRSKNASTRCGATHFSLVTTRCAKPSRTGCMWVSCFSAACERCAPRTRVES